MKTFIFSLFFLAALSANSLYVSAQGHDNIINKKDYIYAIKGNDTLRLTRYYSDICDSVKRSRPVIIFAFGGGFFTGERNNKAYMEFFNYFADRGFQVVSIDYRLGLRPVFLSIKEHKEKKEKIKIGAGQMARTFFNAVDMAVSDMLSATNFVLSKSEEWNINRDKVVISGSSAGAITSLQTEYYVSNNFNKSSDIVSERLPQDFKYAGVISFAGAVVSKHGKPGFSHSDVPIMFFHGNADSNVPYNKLRTPFGGMYGPEFLTKGMSKNNQPYYFYTFDNFNHSIAVSPMKNNLETVESFLTDYVINNKQYIQTRSITVVGMPVVKKRFSIRDYIKANFK